MEAESLRRMTKGRSRKDLHEIRKTFSFGGGRLCLNQKNAAEQGGVRGGMEIFGLQDYEKMRSKFEHIFAKEENAPRTTVWKLLDMDAKRLNART